MAAPATIAPSATMPSRATAGTLATEAQLCFAHAFCLASPDTIPDISPMTASLSLIRSDIVTSAAGLRPYDRTVFTPSWVFFAFTTQSTSFTDVHAADSGTSGCSAAENHITVPPHGRSLLVGIIALVPPQLLRRLAH